MRSVAIFGIGAGAGIVGVISYKLDADQLALVLMGLGLAVICGVALVAMAAIQIRGSVERERIAATRPAQPAQLPPPVVVMPNHLLAQPGRGQVVQDGHGVQVVRQRAGQGQQGQERQPARRPRQWGYVDHE